jgi:hypothetical protein
MPTTDTVTVTVPLFIDVPLLVLQQAVLAEMIETTESTEQRYAIEGVLRILERIADLAVGGYEPEVRRCGRCGIWVVADSNGAWVDSTEGDGCEYDTHFPAEPDAACWQVELDVDGVQEYVECFAANADEAGHTAIRILRETDADDGGCGERGSYRVVAAQLI